MTFRIESKRYTVIDPQDIYEATTDVSRAGFVFRILSSDFVSFEAYSLWRIKSLHNGYPKFSYSILRPKIRATEEDFSFDIDSITPVKDPDKETFCLFYIEDYDTQDICLLALPFKAYSPFFYYLEQLDLKDCLFKLGTTGPDEHIAFSAYHCKEEAEELASFRSMDIDMYHLLDIHFKPKSKCLINTMLLESKADSDSVKYYKNYRLS